MNIDALRLLDLAAVCALLGLARDSDDRKQFKSDGFRICVNQLKWFDHCAGKGGGAIDLTMHVKGLSFMTACAYLDSASGELPTATPPGVTKTRPHRITKPPTPNKNNLSSVRDYLTNQRGLNINLVQWCIDKGLIYADSGRNCVFMYGANGAELRGTGAVQWLSVYGTIDRGFILPALNASGVALLESAIDAPSYRQLHQDMITVSIAGNGNHKVINQALCIAKAKNLPVLSAFDNDSGNIADKILLDSAALSGIKVEQDRPIKKDWNEVLKGKCLLLPSNK
jgi:hypothetical protein